MEQLEETGKTWDNFQRKRTIRKYYKTMNDVAEFARSRPDVNYRHFFKPSESLGGAKTELDFRNETTWHFQEVGRKDAKAALESGKTLEGAHPVGIEHSFANVLRAHYNTVVGELEKFSSYLLN